MKNKWTDYTVYDDHDYSQEDNWEIRYDDYISIKEEIEGKIKNGIVVVGNMNHHYAGYAGYKNCSGQIGIFYSLQDFIDNSQTMQNADYVKISRYGNKLLINTACHDYSTYLEIRQATKLAIEFNSHYTTDVDSYNLSDNTWSYKFFCKEPKNKYHDKVLQTTEELMQTDDFEECLNIAFKITNAGVNIYD